jgi:hypothetical protein
MSSIHARNLKQGGRTITGLLYKYGESRLLIFELRFLIGKAVEIGSGGRGWFAGRQLSRISGNQVSRTVQTRATGFCGRGF